MEDPALSPEPLVPPLVLAACIACVAGAGALAHCSVLAALFKCSRSGLSSILIQLSLADFLILGTFAGELWFYNTRTWNLGSECCTAYRGLSEFASSASTYLIATVALHTIATANLEENAVTKRIKRREDDDDEIRSSHHSLVASSDSSTPPRTMNIDYRLIATRVRVTPPSVFIWTLAASLSVPQFISAITITITEGTTLCIAKDSYHSLYMNSLLAAFNIFVPVTIMCSAVILVINKLKSKNTIPYREVSESIAALKLSMCFIILYFVFCVPRSIVVMYRVYSRNLNENQTSSFDTDQLNYTVSAISLASTSTYMITSVIRPILSLCMLPYIRQQFKLGSKNVVAV